MNRVLAVALGFVFALITVLPIPSTVHAGTLPYTTPSINGDIMPMQGSGGIFTWTDATKAVGDWSAQLDWPGSGGYAQARVFPAVALVTTVSSVNSWSYWGKAPKSYFPNLSFVLDDPDISNNGPIYSGVGYDTVVTVWPSNTGQDDTWMDVLSTQALPYTVWTNAYSGGPVMKTMTWDEFKAPWSQWGNTFDFSNATVLRMNLGKGVIGTTQTITAYVDDFTLNAHTYEFEPLLEPTTGGVPEPATFIIWSLLGALGIAFGWWRRRIRTA